MNITKKIDIKKSASEVWTLLSDDFDKVFEWMSPVHHSYAITDEQSVDGAPMAGRVCEFTPKQGGFHAIERITDIDALQKKMTIEVIPQNAPAALPLIKNTLVLQVRALDGGSSEVIWTTTPELKLMGRLMKSLVRAGLTKSFGDILEELKHFTETGHPHPRKAKKSQKAAA